MSTVWTIYMITGPNGKRYIGQTVKKLAYRWHEHKKAAERGEDHCLAVAIRKHGWENFVCVSLTECVDKREADAVEKGLIAQYGTYWWAKGTGGGYNMTAGGASKASRDPGLKWEGHHRNRKGMVHTPESRAHLSAMKKGKKRSAESVAKQAETIRRRLAADPEYKQRQLSKLRSPEAQERYRIAMAEQRRLRDIANSIQPRVSVRRMIHPRKGGTKIGYKRDRASIEKQRATMMKPENRERLSAHMKNLTASWKAQGINPRAKKAVQ